MSKRKKKRKVLKKISRVVWGISLIFMIVLGFYIYNANVLPTKYFMIVVIIFLLLIGIHGILVFKKKTRGWLLILLTVLAILFMVVEGFAILKIGETVDWLKSNFGNVSYDTNIYYVLVNSNSSYEEINDISGLTVKTVTDIEDTELFESSIKEKVDVNIEYVDTASELLEQIVENTELIIVINSGYYDAMVDVDDDFEESVRILDTITITVEVEIEDTGIDVTSDAFVVYLSGIDTRSNYLPSRSLSDVNIILAVNPTTKKILMIHIPRDYYVQVHGTTGYKDKLTHTGTLGGIELSMATIEDLFEIDIPYYVRVNFNAVVNLVDAIGGITIYSDVNYSFTCWTDSSCTFYPGLNSVGGKCALAFARERHAYDTGDRHRGENQEQVIELIIEKVTSSSTLINNYSSILSSLSGTFQTNISDDDITSLIKMQINDMASWTIETYNVDGTGAYMPTYSYPNQNLYVMVPDEDTIATAVAKLNEVLGE